MTPKEALDRLRVSPGDEASWQVVRSFVHGLAAKATSDPNLRAGAAELVLAKLEDQLLSGDLDPILAPAAWLGKVIRWRINDLVRRRKRHAAAQERAERAEAARVEAAAAEPEPPSAETLAVLDRAFEKAVTNRDPWQRDHLTHAWGQIFAIHVHGRALRDLVAAELGEAADPEGIRLGVQRAHKAHERARTDVLEALDQLVKLSKVDDESAADARRAMQSLRRRQVRARTDVSRAKEPADEA